MQLVILMMSTAMYDETSNTINNSTRIMPVNYVFIKY